MSSTSAHLTSTQPVITDRTTIEQESSTAMSNHPVHASAPSLPRRTAMGRSGLVRAEVQRLLAPGGARGWIIATGVIALAASLGQLVLQHFPSVRSSLAYTVSSLVYLVPTMTLFVLAMAIMSRVPDDRGNGMLFTSFSRVQRHADMFWARLCSWLAIGLAISLAVTVLSVVVGLALNGVPDGSASDWVLSLVLAHVTLLVCLALVFAVSSCLRRGAAVVAVCAAVFLVLPMAVLIVSGLVPFDIVRSALTHVNAVLPGNLLVQTLIAPDPNGSWTPVLRSLGGLVAWAIVGLAFARSRFLREDYIRD